MQSFGFFPSLERMFAKAFNGGDLMTIRLRCQEQT